MSTSGAPSQTRPRTRSQAAALTQASTSDNPSDVADDRRVLRSHTQKQHDKENNSTETPGDQTEEPEDSYVKLCMAQVCLCDGCKHGVGYCEDCACKKCRSTRAKIELKLDPHIDFRYCLRCRCQRCAFEHVQCDICTCVLCDLIRYFYGIDDRSGPWSEAAEKAAAERHSKKRKRQDDMQISKTDLGPSTPRHRALNGSSAAVGQKDSAGRKAIDALKGIFRVPKGTTKICALTLAHGGCAAAIQACHVLPRATSHSMMTKLEYIWGIPSLTFHIHTSNNLLLLKSDFHVLFDAGKWALVPTDLEILQTMLNLSKGKANGVESILDIYKEKNKKPKIKFSYGLLPLEDFDMITRLEAPAKKKGVAPPTTSYVFPYENFPSLSLHIHPHFAICNTMAKVHHGQSVNKKMRGLKQWATTYNPMLGLCLELCRAIYDVWMTTKVPERADPYTTIQRHTEKDDDDARTSKSEPHGGTRGSGKSRRGAGGRSTGKGGKAGTSRLSGQVKKRGCASTSLQDSSAGSHIVASGSGTVAEDCDDDYRQPDPESDQKAYLRIVDWLDSLDFMGDSELLMAGTADQSSKFASQPPISAGNEAVRKPKYSMAWNKTQRGLRPSQDSRKTLVENAPDLEEPICIKQRQIISSLDHLDLAS